MTTLGKGIHLRGDAGQTTGVGVQGLYVLMDGRLADTDGSQEWRGAPLTLDQRHLLTHSFQELPGDIASVPYASHSHPFLKLQKFQAQ